MNVARSTFSRQALVAVAGFSALLLVVALWSTTFLVLARDLQHDFEVKSRTLDALRRQTVSTFSEGGKTVQSAAREGVISAPTGTIAASELHKVVLASLEQAGGAVHSIQAEATTEVFGEGLRRLNAQITFDGSIGALQKILFDLETARPFIFIDALHVQPTTTAARGTVLGDMLRVTLVASSYWKNFETNPAR
jgi:Type II secretion system (T2SS), protein M subtype b